MQSLFVFALLAITATGCKRSTPQPPSGTVPLKVWVVLNVQQSDVFDEPGYENNQGCRLSRADIASYIEALQNNSDLFGTADQPFTWDESIDVVRTQKIPLCFFPPCERRTDFAQAFEDIFNIQGKWEEKHLNIYFCGWMSLNPNTPDQVVGLTFDPGDKPTRPFIFVNDRGWNAPEGSFVSLPDLILEHEVAHFLLRRRNMPPYDSTEHVPDGSDNILDTLAPHPLILPTSETEETRSRILNGTWDNP